MVIYLRQSRIRVHGKLDPPRVRGMSRIGARRIAKDVWIASGKCLGQVLGMVGEMRKGKRPLYTLDMTGEKP